MDALLRRRTRATPVVSRLRGPDGHDYELTLAASLEPASRLGVRFALRDPAGADGEAADSELIRELNLRNCVSRRSTRR